jgi:IS5 family transposase
LKIWRREWDSNLLENVVSTTRYKNGIDEEERAKNRTKSSVRSKVEHVFQVMKLKFGFVKLRYRGLKKNAHQLFVICGLVNLFLSRQKLLIASA